MIRSFPRIPAALRHASSAILVCAASLAMPVFAQDGTASAASHDIGDLKHAGPDWVRGKVAEVSATASGILVVFKKSIVPANCKKSGSYRILIRQQDTSMTHLFMTAWASGKHNFRISTLPYTSTPPINPYIPDRGDNYCTALQIDVK
ncbi:hypothetical protein [Pseudoxanthomonas sp. CF125]|uniref:hypothetical protein n=1 Tax=Pseudoxanthomonas sp. CF125 TaxID=1855303 RepID=UPI000886B1EB|nr:hypothetical protein [Pseudoxanthomonas sp. CF125]SDR13964.1 hypothetical protein SAMN05216569_3296 [Pseudoxanthomonas sp. CF125]